MRKNLTAVITTDEHIIVTCGDCEMSHAACLKHSPNFIDVFHRRHRRYHPAWYMDDEVYYSFENPDPDLLHKREDSESGSSLEGISVTCICGFDEFYATTPQGMDLLDKEWREWHNQYAEQAALLGPILELTDLE